MSAKTKTKMLVAADFSEALRIAGALDLGEEWRVAGLGTVVREESFDKIVVAFPERPSYADLERLTQLRRHLAERGDLVFI